MSGFRGKGLDHPVAVKGNLKVHDRVRVTVSIFGWRGFAVRFGILRIPHDEKMGVEGFRASF